MNNKKGLSQVVTTVIFISLALIAIGIVWAVIQGLIQGGASEADINAKCLKVDMTIDSASCDAAKSCTVTITRKAGGEPMAGVYIKAYNQTGTTVSDILQNSTEIAQLETKTVYVASNTIPTKAGKIEATAYFNDDKNTPVPCSRTAEYNIA